MISFRTAGEADALSISLLHAQSWRQHYRGMLSDAYLDGPAFEDRNQFWLDRLKTDDSSRHLLLAEEDSSLIGFSCIISGFDPRWGALLDNLHVVPAYQGKGIGRKLLQKSACWLDLHHPSEMMYLWIYEKNINARKFYDRMGGQHAETIVTEQVDGHMATICRYVWEDVRIIIADQ